MWSTVPVLGGFQTIPHVVANIGTWALAVPADARRVSLYLSNIASGVANVYPDLPGAPQQTRAFQIPVNGYLHFTWMLDGPMSTYAWWLDIPGGSGSLYWLETLWLPEQIEGG